MEASVNNLVSDLVWPVAEITRSIDAVAKGDLTQGMSLDVEGRPLEGEFLRSAKIVNTMIGQLNLFTSEVTRVAREVGSEGKLGGQAQVKKASGVWKDLTESVNSMASNLTAQVRNIADIPNSTNTWSPPAGTDERPRQACAVRRGRDDLRLHRRRARHHGSARPPRFRGVDRRGRRQAGGDGRPRLTSPR